MREPRLMKLPQGGMLNVDVTLLHIGLSRCRSMAEDALQKIEQESKVDVRGLMHEIIDEIRKTLSGIEDNRIFDEVGELLDKKVEI